uniref:OSJNBb0003B01.6 protein n=1 Tax=Oryza sativa subsp. japonica TaxID=39947 RepID=Q7XPH7_ORYSJ|nr:OSJNBb0003B01.6 [Oryza sativa Japonica Group]
MAKFAAQLKDRFLGLVERVAGCGRGAGDKGVKEPTKLSTVQIYLEMGFHNLMKLSDFYP